MLSHHIVERGGAEGNEAKYGATRSVERSIRYRGNLLKEDIGFHELAVKS